MEINPHSFTPPMINKVRNRFLPLTASVAKGWEPEPKIDDFKIIKQIGEGSFGKVYLTMHKKTKSVYAIKEINKWNKNNQEGKPYFRREIEIMYKVQHKNVVKWFSHFEDDRNCYFVMEYIKNGNLFTQPSWEKNHCFTSFEVAKYMKELIISVYYWHNMNPPIIHRDIKPENVWIDENDVAKWTDFGWSNYVNTEIRSTYCGTPVYWAPEMITEIGHDEHLDIWCIGVWMFELWTGNVPFRGKDFQSWNNNILSLKILWPKDMNLDAKNLISKILKPEPLDRISLENMLKHPFFTKQLNNNDLTCLIKPSVQEQKPFIISKDIPEEHQIMKSDMNKETSTIESNNLTPIPAEPAFEKDNINLKEWYNRWMQDYEKWTSSYNQLMIAKSETNKKLEEANQKDTFMLKEKNNLLREIEQYNKEKWDLMNVIAELKQNIIEKDDIIANWNKTIDKLSENKCKDSEVVTRFTEYENIIAVKDKEINDYRIKILEFEHKIVCDENINDHLNSFRQSISSFNDRLSIPMENSTRTELDEYQKNMEIQLKNTKEYFENELDKMRDETKKEKDKLTYVIKVKDEEIAKLTQNQNEIKEQENKKFEKVWLKYEHALKSRESEIEVLKLKNKKMEMMYNSYIKKKDQKSDKNK